MKYYIAYGSNLNLEQMKHRCPTAVKVGTSIIDDYELLFKGSYSGAYLTIEKKQGSKVPVGVFKIDEIAEASLDRYEGFPSFYYKKEFDLVLDSGKRIKAFAYVMHEDRKIDIPSRFYLETCIIGYSDFGFNLGYLKEALNKSIKEAKKNGRRFS